MLIFIIIMATFTPLIVKVLQLEPDAACWWKPWPVHRDVRHCCLQNNHQFRRLGTAILRGHVQLCDHHIGTHSRYPRGGCHYGAVLDRLPGNIPTPALPCCVHTHEHIVNVYSRSLWASFSTSDTERVHILARCQTLTLDNIYYVARNDVRGLA